MMLTDLVSLSASQRTSSQRSPFNMLGLLVLGIMTVVTPQHEAMASDKPSIYVFLPTSIPPRKLQNYLSEAAPDLKFTVFGRQKDFAKTLKNTPPDAVLAHKPVIERLQQDLEQVLQGTRGGKDSQKYVLVSVDQGLDPANFGALNVGAVDLLGRRQMPKFVANLLGVPKIKVKRVTKVEDLLPLLQFSMADAVMLPPDRVENFKKKSALNLQITAVDAALVGLPSVAVLPNGKRQAVIDAMQKVNAQVMTRMGVDLWKKL